MFESYLKPPISFPTLTGSIVTFNSQYAGLPLKSHKIALTATQSGSGTPSPDNERPINGYSAINIEVAGLNLIGLNTRESGIISGITSEIQADNRIIASGRSTGNADISFTLANNVLLKGGQPYTFSLNGTDTRNNTLFFYIHIVGDGYTTYDIPPNAHSVTFTTSSDVFIDSCLLRTFSGGTVDIDAKAQLEIGSTAHAFDSYSGNAYTITIGSTVYGGEYDARTGVLTVTHGFKTINDLTGFDSLSTPSDHVFRARASDLVGLEYVSRDVPTNAICSHFDALAFGPISASDNGKFAISEQSTNRIVFIAHDYSTVSDFLTAFGTAQIAYPLDTPTTIQLPPCPIDTLEVNNIWADTGDTTLQYIKFG